MTYLIAQPILPCPIFFKKTNSTAHPPVLEGLHFAINSREKATNYFGYFFLNFGMKRVFFAPIKRLEYVVELELEKLPSFPPFSVLQSQKESS